MRREVIETEINSLLKELRVLKRDELASEIERIWDMPVLEYSKSIQDYRTSTPMEPALIRAYEKELKRLDYQTEEIAKIISFLTERRIIQNTPHLVPTYGPRLLSIDWQTSFSISSEDYCVIGMYSGIPFSNDWFPGKLIFSPKFRIEDIISKDSVQYDETIKNQNVTQEKTELDERKITIITSKMQDQLVFRSEITDKTRRMIEALVPTLKEYFNHPSLYQASYSKWATTSCRNLLSRVLNKKKLVYLDINEVVSNYLTEVLAEPTHIFYKIFFDPATRNRFLQFLPNDKIFLTPYMSAGFPSQEAMSIQGNELVSKHTKIELKPETVIKSLKEEKLCPGLLLCFSTLAFLNGFKCLGSFRQAVYLPEYKRRWLESGLLSQEQVESVPACNITTGSFLEPPLANIRPLDIALGEKFNPDPNIPYGEFIISVKERFLE